MPSTDLVQAIRGMILNLEIKPGTWMREEFWAAHFGVSRAPIREAFSELQRAGLLVRKRNRGYLNPLLTSDEKNELIELLICLEVMAIQSSEFDAISTARLLLDVGQASQWQDATPEKLVVLDREWHTIILQNGTNAIATEFHRNVMDRTQRYALAYWKYSDTCTVSFSEHANIEAALDENDLYLACALLRSHYLKSVKRMETVFEHLNLEIDP